MGEYDWLRPINCTRWAIIFDNKAAGLLGSDHHSWNSTREITHYFAFQTNWLLSWIGLFISRLSSMKQTPWILVRQVDKFVVILSKQWYWSELQEKLVKDTKEKVGMVWQQGKSKELLTEKKMFQEIKLNVDEINFFFNSPCFLGCFGLVWIYAGEKVLVECASRWQMNLGTAEGWSVSNTKISANDNVVTFLPIKLAWVAC